MDQVKSTFHYSQPGAAAPGEYPVSS